MLGNGIQHLRLWFTQDIKNFKQSEITFAYVDSLKSNLKYQELYIYESFFVK